jgi:hypothetical protein
VLTNQSPAVLLGYEDEEVAVVDVVWVDREGWFELLFESRNAIIDGYRALLVCWCDNLWLEKESLTGLTKETTKIYRGRQLWSKGKEAQGSQSWETEVPRGKYSSHLVSLFFDFQGFAES